MRPGFFVKEALPSIRRNPIPSFAAMASVLVTLLVLGVFVPMVQTTNGAANDVRDKVQVDVYAKTDATPAQLKSIRQKINDVDGVKRVQFVTKEQAYAAEKKKHPEQYA